jgi:hypothetical protein
MPDGLRLAQNASPYHPEMPAIRSPGRIRRRGPHAGGGGAVDEQNLPNICPSPGYETAHQPARMEPSGPTRLQRSWESRAIGTESHPTPLAPPALWGTPRTMRHTHRAERQDTLKPFGS